MSVHELCTAAEPSFLDESKQQTILSAIEKSFEFYFNYYYYSEDVDINYNIWQILAFCQVPRCTQQRSNEERGCQEVYCGHVPRDIHHEVGSTNSFVGKVFMLILKRSKLHVVSMQEEKGTGIVGGIAEGIRIAREYEDSADLAKLFTMHATNALYFLKWAQDQVSDDCTVGKGGLGYGGVQVMEQRLDVTGHALSALSKLRCLDVLLPK